MTKAADNHKKSVPVDDPSSADDPARSHHETNHDHANDTGRANIDRRFLDAANNGDLESKNVVILVAMLVPATLRRLVASMPLWLRQKIMGVCTFVALVAPLALWIAPSLSIWLGILVTSLAAIFLLVGLVMFAPEDYF